MTQPFVVDVLSTRSKREDLDRFSEGRVRKVVRECLVRQSVAVRQVETGEMTKTAEVLKRLISDTHSGRGVVTEVEHLERSGEAREGLKRSESGAGTQVQDAQVGESWGRGRRRGSRD